jgi:acyl-CoA reductase-like NAD-dependent aldehyde dehydrogenase
MTPEKGFHRDLSQPSGRKSRCRSCHRRAVKTYHDAFRKPRRLAALEAERAAEWKALEAEHRERAKAVKKAAEAGRRRQAKLLAELGMEDVSGEELSRRVQTGGGLYIRGARRNATLAYWVDAA